MTKEMWMDECERICTDFAAGEMERNAALNKLCRMGLTVDEADNLLNEAVS